jgi:hypothetical protein
MADGRSFVFRKILEHSVCSFLWIATSATDAMEISLVLQGTPSLCESKLRHPDYEEHLLRHTDKFRSPY